MRAFLENQNQNQAPLPILIQVKLWKQPLKARFSNFYYGNFHLDCYRFCQQCENHIDTVGVNGHNYIHIAALFLRVVVASHWDQHKHHFIEEVLVTWAEFKSFLQTNLGDNWAFANSICSKFKRDFQQQAESVLD